MMYVELKTQTASKGLILEAIENVSGVPRELWEVRRTSKSEEVILRHCYIHMLHHYARFTHVRICQIVGMKNHSSVRSSLQMTNLWAVDKEHYPLQSKLLADIKLFYEQRNS